MVGLILEKPSKTVEGHFENWFVKDFLDFICFQFGKTSVLATHVLLDVCHCLT